VTATRHFGSRIVADVVPQLLLAQADEVLE
jgi:hypothetical protein